MPPCPRAPRKRLVSRPVPRLDELRGPVECEGAVRIDVRLDQHEGRTPVRRAPLGDRARALRGHRDGHRAVVRGEQGRADPRAPGRRRGHRAHVHGHHEVGRNERRHVERQHLEQPAIQVASAADHDRRQIDRQRHRSHHGFDDRAIGPAAGAEHHQLAGIRVHGRHPERKAQRAERVDGKQPRQQRAHRLRLEHARRAKAARQHRPAGQRRQLVAPHAEDARHDLLVREARRHQRAHERPGRRPHHLRRLQPRLVHRAQHTHLRHRLHPAAGKDQDHPLGLDGHRASRAFSAATRCSRRASASAKRRRSSSVSGSTGGTGVGRPASSSATKVM